MMLLSALYTLTSLRGSSSVSLASAHDECSCLLFQLNATWPLSPASAPCLGSLSGEAGVSCGGEVRHWCVCLFVCVRVCVHACTWVDKITGTVSDEVYVPYQRCVTYYLYCIHACVLVPAVCGCVQSQCVVPGSVKAESLCSMLAVVCVAVCV